MKKPFAKRGVDPAAVAFAVFLVISLALLTMSSKSLLSNVKNSGLSVWSGVRNGAYAVGAFFEDTVTSIKEVVVLRKEYNELTQRMEQYQELERSSAALREENNRLREQMGFSRTLRWKHIAAEISGKDPDNLFSAFSINKGSRDGVGKDMPVIAYQDGEQALVGKVIEAGAVESLVMPIYDPDCNISARISSSRYEGIVEGQGEPDSPLLVRYVSKRAQSVLRKGDLVITSGLGGIYPQGISVGRILALSSNEFETSLEYDVQPSLDFSRLEYVFVLAREEAAQ